MKKLTKIISMIMLAIMITVSFPKLSFAMDNWDTMKKNADAFIQAGKNNGGDAIISEKSLQDFAVPIARTLLAIATVVLTVVTVIIGIQYAMANPEDKAKLKKKLIGLVISTIVIFGAQGIWTMIYKFMSSITGD